MVVSGLALPSAEWGADLVQQITLARQTAVHMALAYQAAGFAVIIDDFWDANHAADYRQLIAQAHASLTRFILYPSQAEAHRRNAERSGDTPARGYIDEGIRIVYQQMNPVIKQLGHEGWQVIDTTTLSVAEVVTDILQRSVGEP